MRKHHRGHHDRAHNRHYCKTCGHYFGTRDAFYGHVSSQHGAPFWQLSFAIAN